MASKREQVLAALHTVLQTLPVPEVRRNEVLPSKIPSGGLVTLWDGDPGDPEVVLSPLTYLWRHAAEIEVVIAAGTPADRDTALDDLLSAIGAALAIDRTLGGLCDHLEAGPPQTQDFAIEGAAAIKGAVVPVTLHYASSDPLG